MNGKKARALAVVTSVVCFALLAQGWAGSKTKTKEADQPVPGYNPSDNEDVAAPVSGPDTVLGTYVGQFGAHRITVGLQNVVGQTVNGYSIASGNERAFSGAMDFKGTSATIHAREPGDHPDDGIFDFTWHFDTHHLTGTWTPNNHKLQTKTFDLERRDFKYNPKLGLHPEASVRPLKTADVENLRPEDLRIMRNEIYARHGYTFRMKDMRDYFDGQEWYVPISFNVSNQLTPTEQRNEVLIKKYENYGSDHYDAFGR